MFPAAIMFLIITTTWGEDRVDLAVQEFTSKTQCEIAGEELKRTYARDGVLSKVGVSYTCVGK